MHATYQCGQRLPVTHITHTQCGCGRNFLVLTTWPQALFQNFTAKIQANYLEFSRTLLRVCISLHALFLGSVVVHDFLTHIIHLYKNFVTMVHLSHECIDFSLFSLVSPNFHWEGLFPSHTSCNKAKVS